MSSLPFSTRLTLSYSSGINAVFCPQRVSFPLEKTPWYGAHPVGCNRPLKITMAIWRPFFFIWTCWVECDSPLYIIMLFGALQINKKSTKRPLLSEIVMATILKRRRNEASILALFSISKRNEPAYSRTCKDRSEANPAYSTPLKDRRKGNSVYSTNLKDRSGANSAIPQIGKIEGKSV